MKRSKTAAPLPKPKASPPPRPKSKDPNNHYPSKGPLLKRDVVDDPEQTWQLGPTDLEIIDVEAKNVHRYTDRLIQKEKERNSFYRKKTKLCNLTFFEKIFTIGDLKDRHIQRLLYNGVPIPFCDPSVFSVEDAELLKAKFHALPAPPKHPWYMTGLTADKTDPEALERL